ncbi:MAG TPA: trypsin-like peptidase domain-containing protein [Candidatus Limnocylindrales bacterium]|nr:trypsin-like peptidase domain-containing protein [Candidatus Limnocylindrales bacterium]
MAERIWAALSKEIAETSAETGKTVVAVLGRRHPSSGVFFSRDAVITVNHALRRDEDIGVVIAPGKKISASVAGRDPSTDMAVLRLAEPVEAPLVRWASGQARVGEFVLGLGRSWRGNIVASSGILSGVITAPWKTWQRGELDQFIRPDLTFYPGFSGGPLVASTGEIIGINTAGLHRQVITVPASTVRRVAEELLSKGRIERPWLGLAMQPVPLPESLRSRLNLNASDGLLVAHVEPDGPADKAGVMLGDVLYELAGKSVPDTESVQELLRDTKPGQAMEAKLVRGGGAAGAKITLGARPSR